MAFTCGFFNSDRGDRKYNAEQISAIFDGIIADGVFATIGDHMAVTPGTGMQVLVGTGKAWFDHTWNVNDSLYSLEIAKSDVTLDRIDAVVLETNHSDSVRFNGFKIVKGSLSSDPSRPNLVHTDLINQHPLAWVRVKAGSTAITASMIENAVGKTECPFVTGIIETTKIDTLFNQWEGEFDEWFANLKTQLSGDVAANLQRQIDENRDAIVKAVDDMTKIVDNVSDTEVKTIHHPMGMSFKRIPVSGSVRPLPDDRGNLIFPDIPTLTKDNISTYKAYMRIVSGNDGSITDFSLAEAIFDWLNAKYPDYREYQSLNFKIDNPGWMAHAIAFNKFYIPVSFNYSATSGTGGSNEHVLVYDIDSHSVSIIKDSDNVFRTRYDSNRFMLNTSNYLFVINQYHSSSNGTSISIKKYDENLIGKNLALPFTSPIPLSEDHVSLAGYDNVFQVFTKSYMYHSENGGDTFSTYANPFRVSGGSKPYVDKLHRVNDDVYYKVRFIVGDSWKAYFFLSSINDPKSFTYLNVDLDVYTEISSVFGYVTDHKTPVYLRKRSGNPVDYSIYRLVGSSLQKTLFDARKFDQSQDGIINEAVVYDFNHLWSGFSPGKYTGSITGFHLYMTVPYSESVEVMKKNKLRKIKLLEITPSPGSIISNGYLILNIQFYDSYADIAVNAVAFNGYEALTATTINNPNFSAAPLAQGKDLYVGKGHKVFLTVGVPYEEEVL